MLQGRGVAIISEVRGTEMSNVVIIINKYYNIYVCIIDKKFFFNWLRNKIYGWTITNNLSYFFINVLLMTILWL